MKLRFFSSPFSLEAIPDIAFEANSFPLNSLFLDLTAPSGIEQEMGSFLLLREAIIPGFGSNGMA